MTIRQTNNTPLSFFKFGPNLVFGNIKEIKWCVANNLRWEYYASYSAESNSRAFSLHKVEFTDKITCKLLTGYSLKR